jgi:hypothetical protein
MPEFKAGTYAYTIQHFTAGEFVVMRHRVMGHSKDRINLSGFMTWWPRQLVHHSHNDAINSMIRRLEGMFK